MTTSVTTPVSTVVSYDTHWDDYDILVLRPKDGGECLVVKVNEDGGYPFHPGMVVLITYTESTTGAYGSKMVRIDSVRYF